MESAMEEQELPARSKTLQRKHIRQLAKTEMCKFFLSNRCGKGLRCTYAHSITEIRSKPDLWKTSMCKEFLQTGNCDLPGCTFAHDERELRTTQEFFKTKMCRFASSGRCKHGVACRFAHEIEELPPAYRAAARAELDAAEACFDRGDSGLPSSMDEDEVPPPPPGMQPSEGFAGEQGSGVGGTSDWGDTIFGSDYNAASSDQSTRADTSASVQTPEGSGDSGQEEASNSPSFENVRGRSGGNEGAAQRRAERHRSGAGQTRHCTTMMLTNVPEFLTQGALVSLLEDLMVCIRGAFDFFYCPWDYTKDRNLGYAIINFFSRSTAAEFEREWSNTPQLPRSLFKRFGIVPAALQGRAANLRHFSGFSLAHHADPRFRPLVRAAPNEALRPMAISEELIAQSPAGRVEPQQRPQQRPQPRMAQRTPQPPQAQFQQQQHQRPHQRRDQQHQAAQVLPGGGAEGYNNREQWPQQVEQLDGLFTKQRDGGAAPAAPTFLPLSRNQPPLGVAAVDGSAFGAQRAPTQQGGEWVLALLKQQPNFAQSDAMLDMAAMRGGPTSPMQEQLLGGWRLSQQRQ